MGRYNIDGGRFGVKLTLATRNHLLGLNVAFPPLFFHIDKLSLFFFLSWLRFAESSS